MKKAAGALILTLFCTPGTEADDWPAAAGQNVFSENGRYFVRIVPGQSVGDSVGFAGAPKGQSPRGFVDPNQQTEIYVFEHFGGTFTFKLQEGAFAYHPGRATCTPPFGPFSTSWFGR